MINIHLPYLLSKISPQISKDFSQIYLPYMCNTFMCNLFKMFNFSNVFVSILNCILWGESSSIKCVHIAANILDQIAKIVLTEFEMYLSKSIKVFVKIFKCICQHSKVYFMGWEQEHKVCPYCGKCGRGEKLMR